MQNKLHKEIYSEFVYSDPSDHLLKRNNNLTRPKCNAKHWCKHKYDQKEYIPKEEFKSKFQEVRMKYEKPNENSYLSKSVQSESSNVINAVQSNLKHLVCIQGDIGDNNNITQNITTTKNVISDSRVQVSDIKEELARNRVVKEEKQETKPEKVIYSEEVFNQIELRGFITKDLLKQSLDRGSNLFHIQQNIFEKLLDRYNQFKEILHTLQTEFDNTVECIIETGKELAKKISHIIYELYLAVMNRVQE